jgi:hypothetical protein
VTWPRRRNSKSFFEKVKRTGFLFIGKYLGSFVGCSGLEAARFGLREIEREKLGGAGLKVGGWSDTHAVPNAAVGSSRRTP